MQYFHEWRSHEWKYNSWCSRMKYISILYVKQINFLFISCFLSDFKYFLLILLRNVAHSPLWRHHIMTSHHTFWNIVLLNFSNFVTFLTWCMVTSTFFSLRSKIYAWQHLFLPVIPFSYDSLFNRIQI
jgi:hypothetical protein